MSVALNGLALDDVKNSNIQIYFYAISAIILIVATIGIGIIGSKIHEGILSPNHGIAMALIGVITTGTLIAFCGQCIRGVSAHGKHI